MRRVARALLVAGALIATPLTARAADPVAAREQLKLGYNLAQEGKYAEAHPHLVESLRLDTRGVTLLNLADCEEHLGRLAEAMGHWVDARQRAQIEGSKAIEDEATARAKALDPRLPRLTLTLEPGAPKDAVVERDGTVLGPPSLGIPLPVDPGPHRIVVKAAGRVPLVKEVVLAEGEASTVKVGVGAPAPAPDGGADERPALASSAAEPPRGGGASPLVYAGFGLAAAGLGVGAVTGLMALSAGSDAEKACPDLRCSRQALDDVESGRTLGTVSTIAFVVAGVGAGVGVFGLLSSAKGDKSSARDDDKRALSLAVLPGGAVLKGRF